jgi:hypothetical protein
VTINQERLHAAFRRPWSRQRLVELVAEVERCACSADPFLRNLGFDLGIFVSDPSPFTASTLATSTGIVARCFRRCARSLEGIGAEIDCHALDQEVEERLDENVLHWRRPV